MRNTPLSKHLAITLALPATLFASPALAQYTVVNLGSPAGSVPGGAATGIDEIAVGDLNDDAVPDFVWSAGGRLGVQIDPSFADAFVIGQLGVASMTIVPASSIDPVDTLYVSNSNGLERAIYDDSAHIVAWTFESVIGGAWANASFLETVSLDDNTSPDLLAVTANRRGILAGRNTQSGFVLSANPIFSTIGEVEDIVACRFNSSGWGYVAAATTYGLEVYAIHGAPLLQIAAPSARGRVAVVKSPSGGERLAWLRDGTSGGRRLSLVDGTWNETNVLDLPANVDVVRSGDRDVDGDDDLILTRDAGQELWVLENDGGLFSTTAAGNLVHAVGLLAQSNVVTPYLGDIDGDGDGDMVMLLPQSEVLHMVMNEWIGHETVTPGVLVSSVGEHLWLEPNGVGLDYRARLSPGGPAGANAIEVFIWRSAFNPIHFRYVTGDVPGQRLVIDLATDLVAGTSSALPDHYDVDLMAFESQMAINGEIRYLSMRYVQRDAATGRNTHAWPMGQSYFVGPDESSGVRTYVENFGFTQKAEAIPDQDPLLQLIGIGGSAGSGGASRCCPDYPTGCPPDTGTDGD